MTAEPGGALSGYRILDLTDSRGAYCTKLLADLGADVIKIEGPEGDPMRRIPPFVDNDPHLEKSLYFLYRNTNKRGITLNLETTEDCDIFRRLVRTADVLVENSPPGYMEKLNLDYQALREINPALVMVSMTEFGRTGPYKDYKGSNLVDLALSTVMISSGFSGKEPCTVPGTPAYDGAFTVAAIGILAALYFRGITGQGQYFDTSVHECSRIALYPYAVAGYSYSVTASGTPPARDMRYVASMYPIYRCKDGLVRIIALAPRQWDALVRVLGSPQVLLMPEWRDFLYRTGNADDLRPIIEEFTLKYNMDELFEAGHQEGVPIAPVYNIRDFINDRQTKSREFFVEVGHHIAGKALYPTAPYKWSETPPALRRPAPRLGEHNEEIFRGEHGLSGKEFPNPQTRNSDEVKDNSKIVSPLEGIRVLSFSTGIALPDFGKTLGELGADVIKVESKLNLDVMRTVGPNINASSSFNESNRNKRSFAVNLKTEKGREIVKRLIPKTDIMAECFRGDVMREFGLDYENVRLLKPDIIYISSQGFGHSGPYSEYQAYGPLLAAMSGMLAIWAHPGDPYPVGSASPLPDHMCGKHLVVAALAALDYRRRTGKGQYIDMAQIEVAAALIGESCLEYTYNNRIPQPMGNRSLYAAPHGCYRCDGDDEWCTITVFADEEWVRFCQATGNHQWVRDSRFLDVQGRLSNVDELNRLIGEWTASRKAHEIMDILQQAGIAAGVVHRDVDDLKDPQLKWLGAIIELDHPIAGSGLYPNVPFRMTGFPPLQSRRAPLLGEHTYEICRKLLGMSQEDVESLISEGILQGADT